MIAMCRTARESIGSKLISTSIDFNNAMGLSYEISLA